MIILKGKYGEAKVFTDNIDNETISQIIELLNQDFVKGCKVRIMSDCHAGKGCVIGFSADLKDRVIVSLIGVDIGCGMLAVKLNNDIDVAKLDEIINNYVPSGFSVHDGRIVKYEKLKVLNCYRDLKDTKRIERSIGTLGGKISASLV